MKLLEREYYEHFGSLEEGDRSYERFLTDPAEMKRFESVMNIIPDSVSSLLDAGCHNGIFLNLLKEKKSIRSIGLERTKSTIKMAKDKYNLDLVNGDLCYLPFVDNSFDAITALEVIEHLPYIVYEKALSELQRVARNYLIVSVPYREARIFATCPYCGCKYNPFYHFRSFCETELQNMFDDFDLIKTQRVWAHYEPIFYKNLRKLYRTFKPFFPDRSLCPACGFRKEALPQRAEMKSSPTRTAGIVGALIALYPKRKTYKWIIAVYHKK